MYTVNQGPQYKLLMGTTFMCSVELTAFHFDHAATIASWPHDRQEMTAWAGSSDTYPATPELFRRWHSDPGVHPKLLQSNAELVAYGEMWMDSVEREVELARLIVAPQSRGKGFGQLLVRRLLSQSASSGYSNAFVRVVPSNVIAIRCYQRVGFSRVQSSDENEFNQNQPRPYVWMSYDLRLLRQMDDSATNNGS